MKLTRPSIISTLLAQLAAYGIETEPIRTDKNTGPRFTVFPDPDSLPLELYKESLCLPGVAVPGIPRRSKVAGFQESFKQVYGTYTEAIRALREPCEELSSTLGIQGVETACESGLSPPVAVRFW